VRSSMVRPGASPGFAAAKPEGRFRVEALTRDGRRPGLGTVGQIPRTCGVAGFFEP